MDQGALEHDVGAMVRQAGCGRVALPEADLGMTFRLLRGVAQHNRRHVTPVTDAAPSFDQDTA